MAWWHAVVDAPLSSPRAHGPPPCPSHACKCGSVGGVPLPPCAQADIQPQLTRRRPGQSRLTTARAETDVYDRVFNRGCVLGVRACDGRARMWPRFRSRLLCLARLAVCPLPLIACVPVFLHVHVRGACVPATAVGLCVRVRVCAPPRVTILSGTEGGVTLGTPIALTVPNEDVRPQDYKDMAGVPRPGHADYTYLV